MKRLSRLSVTLLFLAATAISFHAQQGAINGCYQKNNGQLRMVQSEGDCKQSELAVSWPPNPPDHPFKKPGTRTITALQTLGGTENFAYAINDRDEIVGKSRMAGDVTTHDFLSVQNRVTDISPVDSGNVQTGSPTGINNHGAMASGAVVGGIYVPIIYDSLAHTITNLGSFGGLSFGGFSGVATAINNRDEAVGYSYLDGTNRHAFVYRNGVMRDIGSFGGYSAAFDINDSGTIVGFTSNLAVGRAHAFVYTDGRMTDIDPFGGGNFTTSESYAQSVNNLGEIVGEGLTQSHTGFHAFLNHRGAVTDLGTLPGGRNSYAQSINDPGLVVGSADIPYIGTCYPGEPPPCTRYKMVAFLYANNALIDLNSLIPDNSGWQLVSAFDVNNRSEIVGYGILGGKFRAFELH